jgi:hypothetical protein
LARVGAKSGKWLLLSTGDNQGNALIELFGSIYAFAK